MATNHMALHVSDDENVIFDVRLVVLIEDSFTLLNEPMNKLASSL